MNLKSQPSQHDPGNPLSSDSSADCRRSRRRCNTLDIRPHPRPRCNRSQSCKLLTENQFWSILISIWLLIENQFLRIWYDFWLKIIFNGNRYDFLLKITYFDILLTFDWKSILKHLDMNSQNKVWGLFLQSCSFWLKNVLICFDMSSKSILVWRRCKPLTEKQFNIAWFEFAIVSCGYVSLIIINKYYHITSKVMWYCQILEKRNSALNINYV